MTDEREYVRELARKIAEIAASLENQRIMQRWRDVNGMRKPDRYPVWCRPTGALWPQLLPEDSLVCKDPWLRAVEYGFKQTLVKNDIGDDTPVEDYFAVGAALEFDPPNMWGVDIGRHDSSTPDGAWAYDPPLKTADDFDKLRIPNVSYNEKNTQEALSHAHDVLGDILPVKLVCGVPINATLCSTAADLRGLGEMMMDMIAEPELMHRLMSYLRDSALNIMHQVLGMGIMTPNNIGPMQLSDPIGPAPEDGKISYKNMWVGANAQEYEQVSTAMWKEFLLDYQRPIMDQFGWAAYGCCENLTHKMEGVLTIPNLRVFVSSAWTDLDKVVELVGSNYVIMWRQKATDVVFPDDVSDIKRHLEDGLRKLKGCYVQIVLRELQTLAGHPDRLHVWTKLAKDAAERIS